MWLIVGKSCSCQHKPSALPIVNPVTFLFQSPFLQELRYNFLVYLLDNMDLQESNKILNNLAKEAPKVNLFFPTKPLLDVFFSLIVAISSENSKDQVCDVINMDFNLTLCENKMNRHSKFYNSSSYLALKRKAQVTNLAIVLVNKCGRDIMLSIIQYILHSSSSISLTTINLLFHGPTIMVYNLFHEPVQENEHSSSNGSSLLPCLEQRYKSMINWLTQISTDALPTSISLAARHGANTYASIIMGK